ncbi:Cobalt-zinc-cadmium resistance protein CzcC [Halioglobus japonicus]|nr:Cobalt-zinc-cadmium resistance protein CzcC [Halioglobus japonicus]
MYLSKRQVRLMLSGRIATIGAGLVLTLAVSQGVSAQTSIGLARALQLSLANNQELQLYPYQRNSSEALLLQAGLRPTPRAELVVENALGSGDYSGFDASETTLALSQVIELGEKREQRISVAQARQDLLSTEYELSRLDVLAETSRRYYQMLAVQAQAQINAKRLAQDLKALEITRNRNRAGATAAADVSKLELRVARSRATAQSLDNAQLLAARRLAAMWQGEPDFERVEGDLSAMPALPSLQALRTAIQRSSSLERQFALLRLADASVGLAQANGKNDLTLGLGLRHLEASNDQALVFFVSTPLSFSNPNEGRIRAARADHLRGTREAELLTQTLELELLQLYQQLQNHRDQALQVRDELLPRSRKLIDDIQQGYQLGQYSALQWVDAQEERFVLERELIDLYTTIYLLLLELERITGEPLQGVIEGDIS